MDSAAARDHIHEHCPTALLVGASASTRRGPTAVKHLAFLSCPAIALIVTAIFVGPAHSSSTGEETEDIIVGCNQFIKLIRKGRSRQDPDTMRQIGECLGAVRTMLATEIVADSICPTESTKLIDAVTAFSLFVIQHPAEMKSIYVVPLRQALRAAYPCSAIRQ
jgi:hypothetical protein